MLLFRACNGQKLLQRPPLTFRQSLRIFIFTQIHATVPVTHCFHGVLLRQRSDIAQNSPAAHIEFVRSVHPQLPVRSPRRYSSSATRRSHTVAFSSHVTGLLFSFIALPFCRVPGQRNLHAHRVRESRSGKSRWKNPYQTKMSTTGHGTSNGDFQVKTKLWFRSKFPYESSFALLQLRHWLFCFDGGNSRCRYCMGHGSLCRHRNAISAALFA